MSVYKSQKSQIIFYKYKNVRMLYRRRLVDSVDGLYNLACSQLTSITFSFDVGIITLLYFHIRLMLLLAQNTVRVCISVFVYYVFL